MSAATTIDLDAQGQPIPHWILGSRTKRLGAFLFDALLLLVPFALLFAAIEIGLIASNRFDAVENLLPTLRYFGLVPLALLYESWFTYSSGQTPGKKAMGLKVVDRNGELLTFSQSLLRAATKALSFLHGAILFVNALAVAATSERTGLHDELCQSRVVASRVR